MKRKLLMLFLFIFIGSSIIYGQKKNHLKKIQPNYSNEFITKCIVEVYQDQATKLVFNNPRRYQFIKDFFARIRYINYTQNKKELLKHKEVHELFKIPLNNKLNSSLKREEFLNINNFNPLKYKVNFASPDPTWYIIDNSNYILVIESSQKINRK
ncbi:hypothetical protein KO494_00050 [Lacinutrix sp. C3R15]|uniref:hypothetical protein n=1 Tax=Flavobacteriaceae TaxID=49546 RepID=UPI001C09F590|nr:MULTISPECIES: hypothetical protein [Flavobacteriaceae]MBU2937917.1 hypothetical protein [Lacinutrix sp. C3R15]MDO6621231.1 hypothetical protein [Oceanihabitans sp. 1_MG-2023]